MRTEIERCSPEAVGIPSSAINALVDRLENGGFTQMHGLMIMRYGKVCAEGWWAPFAANLHHACHSLSKTYTATAIGIAQREGLLKLTDRVVDLLPEYVPEQVDEKVKRITVRDLLVMGSGLEDTPLRYGEGWIREFLSCKSLHEPGTFWRYDSTVTSMLSAIIKAVSGESMTGYLKTRLFEKIGIDPEQVMCRTGDDGTELGGGGMFTTTEDNLRLMMLYMAGGVFDGERILDEAFVKEAISKQMDTAQAHAHTPWIYDNCVGYGYQIWMCRPEGSYRMDGAYGQFCIAIPDKELIIAVNESAYLGSELLHSQIHLLKGKVGEQASVHGPQATLNAIFETILPAVQDEQLPEDIMKSEQLAKRLQRLAIAKPQATYRLGERVRGLTGKRFSCIDSAKCISFFPMYGNANRRIYHRGAEMLYLTVDRDVLRLQFTENGKVQTIEADLCGRWRQNDLDTMPDVLTQVSAAAYMNEKEALTIDLMWIETEVGNRFTLTWDDGALNVKKQMICGEMGALCIEEAQYRE